MVIPRKNAEAEKKKLERRKERIAQKKLEQDEAAERVKPVKELSLEQRIDRLEFVAAKMAHFKGCGKIITEVNMTPWFPNKRDMTKWKNEHKERPSNW